MSQTILAICAHNDDQIVGAGGTLAKYAAQGKRIRTVICSFGESSHPHLKREVIVERRVKESLRADKILGGSGVAYFGLTEGKFIQEFEEKKIRQKIMWIINKEKPVKIFTHSSDDAHPDHRAVNKLITKLLHEKKITCAVFEFQVWNIIKLTHRNNPRLIVDITKTFATKIRAFGAHTSQKLAFWNLIWSVVFRARLEGFFRGYKYAEVFYKL